MAKTDGVLTRQRVLEAALQLIDREGLEGFSMRKLGAVLGVEAMSLYNHVENKGALFDGVIEVLVLQAAYPEMPDAAPRDELWAYIHALRDVLRAHPRALPLVATNPFRTPATLAVLERLLAALYRANIHGVEAIYALQSIAGFLFGQTLLDVGKTPVAGFEPGPAGPVVVQRYPAERFPTLHAALQDVAQWNPDQEFDYGLQAMFQSIFGGNVMSQETLKRDQLNNIPPLGKLYDIGGGRRLMLHHAGSGTPAVVIEAGGGAFGLDYYNIFELCAQRTACVLYDRAGSGWSDPVDGPRSAAEIVADLHSALGLANVNGPYVLVGHSLGGLFVRAFTQHFPSEVVGLVLIDPASEGIPMVDENDTATKAIVEDMLQKGRANPDLWREWYPEMFADWEKLPAQVRDPLIARHTKPGYDEAGLRDMMSSARILAEVANGPALPDVPITVLTGMKIDPTPGRSNSDMEAFNKIKLDAHRKFVNSLPQGEHRVLEDVGHRLTAERPEVVANAIFDILDRVAKHQS